MIQSLQKKYCFSFFLFLFFLDLFTYQTERDKEHTCAWGGDRGRETQDSSMPRAEPNMESNSGPRENDLSQEQESEASLTEPSRRPGNELAFKCKSANGLPENFVCTK